jgi:hypothetical protein
MAHATSTTTHLIENCMFKRCNILPASAQTTVTDVVENLWTDSANPVENLTRKIFFCADPLKTLLAAVC